MERVRVDRWLWAVRLAKTRTAATAACAAGHVDVNEVAAKPSTPVAVGDRVRVRQAGRVRDVEVVELLVKRVGAPAAATALIDHSPPVDPGDRVAPPMERDRGAGRPTKKDRRAIDRMRRS